MKKLISLLCLTIMALSITMVNAPPKTSANADSNDTYYTLHNTYDWWKFVPPSTNTYGTQTSDKIYWGDVDVARLYMYPSPHSGNGTLHSDSVLNWEQTNIYIDVIYAIEGNNSYQHRWFTLKKGEETIYLKNYTITDKTSVLLYSGNLDEGNYTFMYSGAYTEFQTAVITFTYTFNFTIHHHNYTAQTVPPTCTENGYTRHTCLECGDYYDTDIVPVFGHHFVSTVVSPTCTESGGTKHTCTICGHEYMTDITLPSGHDYDSQIIKEADCEHEGERQHDCENCDDHYREVIPNLGHNYTITDVIKEGNTTKRVWTCNLCGDSYTEDLGNQYEKVASYVELLFNKYSPYMVWIFLATSGIWSIFIGIYIIIAQKNEEKEKARKMLINYAIGLVAIFAILVAAPLLIRGIAALVT